MRRLLWPLVLTVAVGALAVVPSPRPVHATDGCAAAGSPAGPFDLLAYEAADWRTMYRRTLEYAAFNQLFPELSSFALPRIETGPRTEGSSSTVDPYVPPVLLKAIAWIESAWQMATVDYGEVGPPLVSPSCAYGIMQILSGMQNTGSAPTLEQVSIGSHYGFNIATGARILAEKWNYAPTVRPLIGSRDPSLIEDWYYAIWSYHGFAFTNHPLNPSYSSQRGVYRCDGSQSYGSFPYQELILGCVTNPPVEGGTTIWGSLPVTLPNLSHPAFSLTNWDACSDPDRRECAGMDIPTPTPSHTDPKGVGGSRSAAIGSPALSVGPLNITLIAGGGGQSEPVTLTIANSGTGPLTWRFSPSATWMRYSRFNGVALGSDIGSQPSTVSLWADSAGLSPGTYTGAIFVYTLYPQTTITINVTLIVGTPQGFVPGVTRG